MQVLSDEKNRRYSTVICPRDPSRLLYGDNRLLYKSLLLQISAFIILCSFMSSEREMIKESFSSRKRMKKSFETSRINKRQNGAADQPVGTRDRVRDLGCSAPCLAPTPYAILNDGRLETDLNRRASSGDSSIIPMELILLRGLQTKNSIALIVSPRK